MQIAAVMGALHMGRVNTLPGKQATRVPLDSVFLRCTRGICLHSINCYRQYELKVGFAKLTPLLRRGIHARHAGQDRFSSLGFLEGSEVDQGP